MKLILENWRQYLDDEENDEGDCKSSEIEDLATWAHDGQFRRDGTPYITHPAGVAKFAEDFGYSDIIQDAAWLHDAVEDFQGSEEDIKELIEAVCPEALPIVLELTHDPSIVYTDYVLSLSEEARAVKLLDILYNSQDLTPEVKQFKKYHNALLSLGGKPEGINDSHWGALETIYGDLK